MRRLHRSDGGDEALGWVRPLPNNPPEGLAALAPEAVKKLPGPAVARNSPLEKGAAPKARGCLARPESQGKSLARFEIRCAEVRLSQFARQPPGGCAASPF